LCFYVLSIIFSVIVLASELGPSFISCPNQLEDGSVGTPFKQYSGHWRDYSVQLLGPLQIFRHFRGENRSYAAYGPLDDPCPERFYFSRFPFLLADKNKQLMRPTGELKSSSGTIYFFVTCENTCRYTRA